MEKCEKESSCTSTSKYNDNETESDNNDDEIYYNNNDSYMSISYSITFEDGKREKANIIEYSITNKK